MYKALVELNYGLERRWRYSLGISTEDTVLKLLEQLIMAKNGPKPLKGSYLIKASSMLELARMKLRAMLELKLLNETKIFQLQGKLEEIGRMLGGWLKSMQ